MVVEGVHLVHIGFDACHVDRVGWADDGDASFVLQLFYPGELVIVALATGTQNLAQLGIAAIDERWYAGWLLILAVASMASEHYYGFLVALLKGTLQGDGVGNAAIEHGTSIDMGNGACKG